MLIFFLSTALAADGISSLEGTYKMQSKLVLSSSSCSNLPTSDEQVWLLTEPKQSNPGVLYDASIMSNTWGMIPFSLKEADTYTMITKPAFDPVMGKISEFSAQLNSSEKSTCQGAGDKWYNMTGYFSLMFHTDLMGNGTCHATYCVYGMEI